MIEKEREWNKPLEDLSGITRKAVLIENLWSNRRTFWETLCNVLIKKLNLEI